MANKLFEVQRLAQRAAIASDGFAPMLYNVADFPTARTHFSTNVLDGNVSLEAIVTLEGERMAAFSWQDEYGNTYPMPGDATITGTVSASNDTTQHAEGKTDFALLPLFLLFPNVSPGARLRLHFDVRAELLAADATHYTGHPDDGPEERKHREHLRAELGFTLTLDPLLTEELLEENT